MRRFCVFLLYINALFSLAAQESLEKLLLGYFKNSIELMEFSSKVEKAALKAKSTSISNGMNISISTGNIVFSFGNGGSFSFLPRASLDIPAAQNLKFTASSNISVNDGNREIKNTSLGVSVDIYSGVREQREIALLLAERELLEARRALQNGFVNAETEFYSKLKSLYEIAAKIISAQKSLYEHNLEFEELRVKGYSTTSSKYRLKQMEVESDKHDVEICQRELEREVKIFAQRCGVKYNFSNAMEFLPVEIPILKTVDVFSFEKNDFAEIESAVWKNTVNSKTREAEKTFTVAANAGYTFSYATNSFMKNEKEYGDTVDLGSSFRWHTSGLQADAGISFPVSNFSETGPIYKLSFSLNPNQFRLAAVQKKSNEVDERLELLAIEAAKKKYDNAVVAQQSTLEELEWAARVNSESYKTYVQLESDSASWYKRGIITESEYKSAQVNKENYRIKILINALDFIIYNNNTKILFNRDKEMEDDGELEKEK